MPPPATTADSPGVALVTGGTRGIGLAVVRELARRGYRVAFTYASSVDAAASVRDELTAAGVEALALPFALERPEGADQVVADVVARFGGLDVVVLNAGVWKGGRLDAMDPAVWTGVVSANVLGTMAMVRASLDALARSDRGSVVFVSSVVGLAGFPGDTAYASAKAAMVGMARSLAKEVARDGIRVNVLAPGFVETDMTAAVPERAREQISRRILLRRFGEADEVAKAAVFLAVDATYTTGAVVTVDGGWSL